MSASRAPDGPRAALGSNEGAAFQPHAASAVDVADGGAPSSSSKQICVKALSVGLKDTYRKVNPERPVGSDAVPRRVLTHPSFPVANGCVHKNSIMHAAMGRTSCCLAVWLVGIL